MNERRSKKKKKKDGEPATEENRSERQTFIRGGGAVSPCRRAVFAACLSPLYLEHQPHQQEDKTKKALPSLSCSKPNMQPGHMEGG